MNANQIVHATPADWPFLIDCFEQSIQYQQSRKVNVWLNYDQQTLQRDLEQGNLYKVTDGTVAQLFFSVTYRDPVIWRQLDQGDAIYLHRLVVNPEARGRRLFGLVLDWARSQGHAWVRMDTWADNTTLIDYYLGFGFSIVGHYTTPDTADLPTHNRNLKLVLLQYKA